MDIRRGEAQLSAYLPPFRGDGAADKVRGSQKPGKPLHVARVQIPLCLRRRRLFAGKIDQLFHIQRDTPVFTKGAERSRIAGGILAVGVVCPAHEGAHGQMRTDVPQKIVPFGSAEALVEGGGIDKIDAELFKQAHALGKRIDLPAVFRIVKGGDAHKAATFCRDRFRLGDQLPVADMHAVKIPQQQDAILLQAPRAVIDDLHGCTHISFTFARTQPSLTSAMP